MKCLKTRLIEKAEELDWKVTVDGTYWEFAKYSPAGEDFVFSVEAKDDKGVWREVRVYANYFDPEDHVVMWVEAKRNGVEGVPNVRQLVEDADAIEKMLDELAEALRKETKGDRK